MIVKPGPTRAVVGALIDPVHAIRQASGVPVLVLAAVLAVAVMALGGVAIPRQLALLSDLVPHTGDPVVVSLARRMHSAIVRLVVVDRLLPPLTFALAAGILCALAAPVLSLSQDDNRQLVVLAILGLAPLLVLRLSEAVLVWLVPAGSVATLGDTVTLPQRFVTGPKLLWRGEGVPPAWLETLDARLNLFSLWCAALWAAGLRFLDGGRLALWHVILPAAAFLLAGLVTWALGPLVLPVVLGGF